MFLAHVTRENLELVQFDVCAAFLYGELEEEVFMKIPEGVNIEEEDHSARLVCQLNKSLYGLKQAPRCWNKKFNDFLMKFNMVQSEADQCIYIGEIEKETVYLAMFVDDGLAACKSSRVLDKIIEYLKGTFEITIGDASRFTNCSE